MSSLADLPEIIGFFSYSREDDEGFKGMLSALRDGIQRELGAQLGRSKRTFRLWQDQEAIAPGRLWETEIKRAVEQSVFFIPIVTPRAVNSEYCQFEFEAFLARERTLGRSDLVFPILYIAVPALEDEAQWRNHPVLSAIGRRQYVDWRPFRHLGTNTTVVGEAIERFCGKIVEALNEPWLTPEERRRQEEAAAQQRAEDERRRQEAEAERRAEEEARRKKDETEAQRIAEERQREGAEATKRAREEEGRRQAEEEARQRAEEERRGREAEAKQRADQEQAFAAAKRADAVGAMDQFLAAYPESHLAGEAKALRATLIERDDAHGAAMSSTEPTVLKAFLEHYPAGTPADQVRRRLRRLEPPQPWQPSRRAMLIGGGALGAGALGALATVAAIMSRRVGLIRTLTGNTGEVTSVAITPDGGTALSGSLDETLGLWNLASGTLIRTLTGHTLEVSSVAIASDGRTALSGSGDKTLRLWDLASGSTIRTLTGHSDRVTSVAIAPNGGTALSGSLDGTVRIWNLASGDMIRTLQGHNDGVSSVAIAPDGRTALSGSWDKSLRLWDLASGSTIRVFTGHTERISSVAIAPRGRVAISGSYDKTLKLWDWG
jgi:flagellar biosynthesis GTPase FlhF